MKVLNIIDSFGLFFKLYYAMMGLKSSDGKPSGMVSGFASFIQKLQRDFPSDYIVFALEGGGKTFRDDIYPLYKANRNEAPAELKEQLVVCIDMIKKMEFGYFSKSGFEADDIIASLVKKYKNECKINILSSDKDLFALIDESVNIIDTKKNIIYNSALCFEKFGVYPSQIKDYLSIIGDSSDNVPGIKGLGPKAAKTLLEQFNNLENIYANIEKITNLRTKNALLEGRDSAILSQKLITLKDDIQTPPLNAFEIPQNPLFKIEDILKSYSLNRVMASIKPKTIFDDEILQNEDNTSTDDEILQNNKNNKSAFEAILILDENLLNSALGKLDENSIIAFDTETTGLDTKTAKIVGFSFAFSGEKKAYYVPLAHSYLGVPDMLSLSVAKTAIKNIFKAKVIGHNLKYDFEIIKNNFDISYPQNYADTMILSWLSDPVQSHSMDKLAKKLFDYETIKFKDITPKGGNFGDIELNIACKYASEDAFITMKFYEYYLKNLDDNLLKLAKSVEFPFLLTLLVMQNSGISADLDLLNNLNEKTSQRILLLQKEIFSFCKSEFNINSPKQLADVLFNELNLKPSKKSKTGFSTNESVLQSLEHPIIAPLLEFRELSKLKSTYIEPFIKLCKNNERIYTNFMQTGTATGRLSSNSPNLQNIPARGLFAKQMRSCFVAGENKSFISLDYSQIELRLLAHFSKDPLLLKAFNEKEDIHARTAISLFGSSDDEKRSIAKSINFGLIYGMGASKLAMSLKIPSSKAKEYILRYFDSFPTIKGYLQSIKEVASQDGFVSTILGRKRFFDFKTADQKTKALFEREAVNTVFQGSAADIIKLAMNEIFPLLNDEVKMILQIHDELIFEVPTKNAENFAQKVASIMQNTIKLNVPLIVNYAVAKSWGELK